MKAKTKAEAKYRIGYGTGRYTEKEIDVLIIVSLLASAVIFALPIILFNLLK